MSIDVSIRRPNGTMFSGRILYDRLEKRKSAYCLVFKADTFPSFEDVSLKYGVCPTLQISPSYLSKWGQTEDVYRFLYGYTLDNVLEQETEYKNKKGSMPVVSQRWVNEPIEWTDKSVSSMDWDMFCLTYYTVLISSNDLNNDFNSFFAIDDPYGRSKAWETIIYILQTLKNEEKLLQSIFKKCELENDRAAIDLFWETVSNGLCTKICGWLEEKTCYTAFYAMKIFRPFIMEESFTNLEKISTSFFDKIAMKRIDEALQKINTAKDIKFCSTEDHFFFREYLEDFPISSEVEQRLNAELFKYNYMKADKVATDGDVLFADKIYEMSLKYAKTDTDIEFISRRREGLLVQVNEKKAELEKKKEEENRQRDLRLEKQKEKEEEEARQKAKRFAKSIWIYRIMLAVGFLGTVLFGIFMLLDLYKEFSIIAFIISCCLLLLPFVWIIIEVVMDELKRYIKRRKRNNRHKKNRYKR